MAKHKQSTKIVGIILLLVGLGLGFRGHEMSQSYQSQFKRMLSGSSSNEVITLYVLAATGVALGAYLICKK